jgi:GWxTD domain-containing protein
MGLTVAGGDVPFVARLAYLAGATPDSTLALVTLSLAARALTFAREGAGYRADYDVRLEVRRAPAAGGASAMVPVLREAVGEAAVRVATFRETSRGDESVVHAQTVALPPGRYALAVTVRDAGSGRATTADVLVRVPRLGPGVPGGGLSTPLAVYEARPRVRTGEALRVLVNARATAAVGRDTTALVYVEAYGGPASAPDSAPAGVAAAVLLRDDRGAPVWRDSLVLARVPAAPAAGRAPDPAPAPYAGVARVPVSRLGFGVLTFQIVRRDAPADTAAARLLVTLGNELPATSFDEAIGYLRYYAAPDRLRAVREAGPRERPARWAAFLASTDPDPRTPAHEGLADYVARLRAASARFAEAGAAGWATDRGRAYLVLGEPDQITDANVPEQGQRGRTQVWEYREPRVQLVFTDQHGRGRWRIAPTGAAALDAVLAGRFARRAGP